MFLRVSCLLAALPIAAQQRIVMSARGSFTAMGGIPDAADFDRTGTRMLTSSRYGDLVLTDTVRAVVLERVHVPGGDVLGACLHPERPLAAVIWGPSGANVTLVDLETGRASGEHACGSSVEMAFDSAGDHLLVRTQASTLGFRLLVEAPPGLQPIGPAPADLLARCAGRWRGWGGMSKRDAPAPLRNGRPAPSVCRGRLQWWAETPGTDLLVCADSGGQLHLWRDGGVRSLAGAHAGPVLGLVWSPDGRFVAASSHDMATCATAGGDRVRPFPDAGRVAAGGHGSEFWMVGVLGARLVDVDTGTEAARTLPGKLPSSRRAWSLPEPTAVANLGDALALQSGSVVMLWNGDGLHRVALPHQVDVRSDLQLVATPSRAGVFAVLDGQWQEPCTPAKLLDEPGAVHVLSADGRWQHTACLRSRPSAAAFTPDYEEIVVATRHEREFCPRDGNVVLHERPPRLLRMTARSGRVLAEAGADAEFDWLGVATPDGAAGPILIAIDFGPLQARAVVLEPRTLAVQHDLDLGTAITAAALAPDGGSLALGRGTTVEIHRLTAR